MKMIEIKEENYKTEVEQYKGKIFMDFYADWCGPCRMMGPIIDEISEEVENIKFVKINVDDNEEVAKKFGIMSIPTFVVLDNQEIIAKKIGSATKEEIKNML